MKRNRKITFLEKKEFLNEYKWLAKRYFSLQGTMEDRSNLCYLARRELGYSPKTGLPDIITSLNLAWNKMHGY